jgi:hypothetical protein
MMTRLHVMQPEKEFLSWQISQHLRKPMLIH